MSETRPLPLAAREDILTLVPAAVAVLHGPEHVFTFANHRYRELVRREVVGLPVREALPEIPSQGFVDLLDRVLETGAPYVANEAPVDLVADDGSHGRHWVNFAYLPILENGTPAGILVHAVDVSELVEARESARDLAQTLETIFDRMPAGAVLAGPGGEILLANRVFREFFPVAPESTPTLEEWEAYAGTTPDGRPYRPEQYPLARSLLTGDVVDGELVVFPTASGPLRTIAISSAPVRSPEGEITSAVATFFDVTERDWSRRLLEDQNRVLELVATGAPLPETLEALVQMIESRVPDARGSILLLDEAGERLLHGAAPSLPAAYNDAVHGIAIGPSVGSCGTAAYRGERVVVTDIETDPLWADFRDLAREHGLRACWSTPIMSADGQVLGTFAVYHDEPMAPRASDLEIVEIVHRTAAIAIANRRLLEGEQRARAEAERRAQAAFALEQIHDGVALVDEAGAIGVWSRAAAAITGVPAERALGRRLADLIGGWDAAADRLRAASGPQTVPVELQGREAWLEVGATRFDGGTVFAFRDVTDERRLEAMRSDFVATVSHELRTPVTAVYGAIRTLERPEVRGDAALTEQLFEVAKSEATRLVQLVEEILLASNLDGGAVEVEVAGVDALAVAQEAAATFAASGAAVTAGGERLRASADRQRLLQVIDNLVDNGLKYGGGQVEIEVAAGQGGNVCVLVSDHGPGIPAGERRRVFEKFVRLDPDMRTGVNGTGLGLYIVRELVERMGGRVWIESRADGAPGSVFAVALRPA